MAARAIVRFQRLIHTAVMRTKQGQRGWEARASAILPGGVNSPVRAWNSVGGHAPPIVSGRGATVTDLSLIHI